MSSTTFLPPLKRTDLGNVRRSNSEPMRNIDWILMLATLGIAAVGLLAIYSTSRPFLLYRGFDPYTYTQRQVIFLVIGAFVMAAVMSIDYGELKERAAGLYLLTILTLLAVLILGTGPAGSGANAWFDLGPILVQPSEFAKVTVLVLIAGYLADERTGQLTYARFISVLALATIGALIGSGFVKEYQVQRLTAFTVQNTENEQLKDLVQQVRNSKRAIATGGLSGKGYLNGPLTNGRFIPVQWTDFVFSGIAEQFGLIGTITLLMLYFFVLFRIWRIARLARDDFGLYICVGAMTMIAWHVFENIGMTMGIMPVTGIPLPLVSYGGSSTIATLAMIGLVQNVHMRRMR